MNGATDKNREYGLWFAAKAKYFLRIAKLNLESLRYAYAVTFAADAIEFAGKSILEFYDEPYSYDHVSTKPLDALGAKYPMISTELSKLALSSSKWCGKVRDLSRYGGQTAKVSAPRIFDEKSDAEDAVGNAIHACSLLRRVEISKKLKPPIKIGILNGKVTGDESESACTDFLFTDRRFNWSERLSQINDREGHRFLPILVDARKIDNSYAIVLNPFGEVYPDTDFKRRPVFEAIKEYISDGGIFVNVAGWAFYYAWNVTSGGPRRPIFLDRFLVPRALLRNSDDPKEMLRVVMEEVMPLGSSLLWSEFGCRTTFGGDQGPQSLALRQNEHDREIAGDIVSVGSTDIVREFRSLTSGTEN
jgi:HEPN domain-containing protein